VSDGVSFYDGSYRSAEFPFFAKKGWTRPKEDAAKHPLWSGRGSCFKLPLIYPNRLDKRLLETTTPSAPLRNGAIFLMAQPPLLRKGGDYLAY